MKKNSLLGMLASFVLIQFVPAPAKTNPPADPARSFTAAMKPSEGVQSILKRACYDCHSNETIWPWYAHVAPVSWIVRQHVDDGRRHLNFSEWLKPGETSFTSWSDLEGVCKVLREKSMPLPGYDWVHREAKVSHADEQAVCAWVDRAISGAK